MTDVHPDPGPDAAATARPARVEFCGEEYVLPVDGTDFVVGREGDLVVDDENPYLHRRFLVVRRDGGLWWLENTGSLLCATVADETGLMQAYLSPGGRLPLVFGAAKVWFTAGPTTYEFTVVGGAAAYLPTVTEPLTASDGSTTVGRLTFTPSQRLLVLALAEPLLRNGGVSGATVPTSATAAARLGWPLTTFNRKLDNVCEKLTNAGVGGLHAGAGRRASNRRARLVEYAVASRLVTVADLRHLDAPGRGDAVLDK